MKDQINTETRVGRMLDALVSHGNRNARVAVTVTITGTRSLHQTFRMKTWKNREDGTMISLDLNDGSWADGTYATKILHFNVETGQIFPAKGEFRNDKLMQWAGEKALRFAITGEIPAPTNGTVEIHEESFCGACGKELDRPESIELGVGPECAKRCGLAHHYKSSKTIKADMRKRTETPAVEVDKFEGFTPAEREAYSSYVSQGIGDSDGYFGPLHPQSWLATHRRTTTEPVAPEEAPLFSITQAVYAAADALHKALQLTDGDPHDRRGEANRWLSDLLREGTDEDRAEATAALAEWNRVNDKAETQEGVFV